MSTHEQHSAARALPASGLPRSAVVEIFNRGYAGYYVPLTIDEPAFNDMLALQDIDLDASRILEWEGAPAAFAMLGIRESRGWIGGMGVVAEARGHGLGRAAMEAVLESARTRGLRQVDLEVLVQNQPAIRIYEDLGFRDVRELGVWMRAPEAEDAPGQPERSSPGGGEPDLRATAGVVELDVAECMSSFGRMKRAPAPWQREERVVQRVRDRLQALGKRGPSGIGAWILYRVHELQARLMDAALAEGEPISSLDSCLQRLLGEHPRATVTYLNLPIESIEAEVFARAGLTPRYRQREMRLLL